MIEDKLISKEELEEIQEKEKKRDLVFEQGLKFGKQQNYKDALNFFEEALKIDPNFKRAWTNKGWALIKLGESNEKIIECFVEAFKIDPNYTKN